MTQAISWPEEYAALIERLPRIIDRSRLVVGGFSTCVDIYLSLHEVFGPLKAHLHEAAECASLLRELKHRAVNGVGGELFFDWPDGATWIDRHVAGKNAIGGTAAQASYMLAQLGAQSLTALEDRSAGQLAVLHPDSLVATKSGMVPVSTLAPETDGRAPHYIFEFTAGERLDGENIPRSSRIIVCFEHSPLQHDPEFVRVSLEHAPQAGAGILCGFNEVHPEQMDEELDYAAETGEAWHRAGLPLLHLELADFPNAQMRDATIDRILPVANSLSMSLSELKELTGEVTSPVDAALKLAQTHALERICVHADTWAFTVTRDTAKRELDAIMTGCLLASARAAAGYFAVPRQIPEHAEFRIPPLPVFSESDGWSVVCCAAPYLEKPAATIGLGDTFLAGTLLVLGGSSASGHAPAFGNSLKGGVASL
ncbi:ADP-dependent glucokinase/phosphofructokinase [Roseibium sp. HPY-6]|uniref:ADP-dependent glucokinase/phosphofructokinase n=1 Tax=Roseibium sp. HPY-6 TaxID=3229852 RepID=UPI00338F57CC